MIFEIRTYLLKPGTAPQADAAFAERIEARSKLSPIAGFWRTEVGTLNQIIHIWPYKDTNERAKIRAEVVEKKVWPPAIADFVINMESKVTLGAPFSPNFPVGAHGGLYEFRTYTYGPGAVPKVIEAWSPRIKQRSAVSPLIFAGFTDIGALNQWIHVWAYKNMGDRETKRAQAMNPPNWPPPRGEGVVLHKQNSTFAVPAAWSPTR